MKERKIINFLIVGVSLAIIFWITKEEYNNNKIEARDIQYNVTNLSQTNSIEKEERTIADEKNYPKEEIIDEYKGYDVTAKLEIPQIKLETYILKNYSSEALNISVTRFWGVEANEVGNFCVVGHNFQNANMFSNLKNTKIGERLTISNNKIGKVEYEIYDIYTVVPEDVSCLDQETNGKREVTLITCTNDSQKRIIVKAREIEDEYS